jgi:hypothetical protein
MISSRLLKTLRPDAVKKINMEKTPFKQMASDSPSSSKLQQS